MCRQKEPLHKEGESFSIKLKSYEFRYGKQKKNYPSRFLSEKRGGGGKVIALYDD